MSASQALGGGPIPPTRTMLEKELTDWIRIQSKKITAKYGYASDSQQERIYARTLKLTEEVGELCAEVLAVHGDQRADKLDSRQADDLAHEMADVLICTLLLAETMGVDPNVALRSKIAKIDKRFEDVHVT